MQDAPHDLFAEPVRQLGRPAHAPELQEIITTLHAPKHENGYFAPSEFAAKFGLKMSAKARAAEGAPVDAGDVPVVQPVIVATPLMPTTFPVRSSSKSTAASPYSGFWTAAIT
jgi:hypothetical protein